MSAEAIQINLLGPPQLLRAGQPLAGWRSRKALALLAYLALHDGPAPRPVLADLLWPESAEARGRANLSWALNHVNGLLARCLVANRHAVRFAPDNPAIQLDTEVFARLRERNTVEALEEAVALVQGELLEGFALDDCPDFELWLLRERERWQRLTADAWSGLIAHHRFAGNYEAAVGHARRLLAYIPWQESAHRNLMLVLALSGRRTAALAQYETCRRLLAEELAVEPSPETASLFAAIRDGDEALMTGWTTETDPLASPGAIHDRSRPAGRTAGATAPRHNLPRQYSSFVGRERELSAIAGRLEEPETALITLAGPGGVGKTRLALSAAAQQLGRFADGVFFVPLASLTALENVLPAVAEALRFPVDGGPDAPPLEEQLLRWLADREILLALDNLEQLGEPGGLLLRLLKRAPRIKLLVTSRHHLNLRAEVLIELAGLPFPSPGGDGELADFPAVRLFVERTRRRRHDYELTSDDELVIARLCGLLAGNPLALELAAALTDSQPLKTLAAQIAGNLDTLQSTAGDALARHLSLRAVFDHSWQLLSHEQQRALASLTVFRGGFVLDAFLAVSGAGEETLRQLVSRSLVRALGGNRFDLHPLIGQYLREAHDEKSYRVVSSRHSRYFLSAAQRASGQRSAAERSNALAQIHQERENVVAAWQHALALSDLPAIRAATAGLYRYWRTQPYFQAGVDFFQQAATAVDEQEPILSANLQLCALGCVQWESYQAEHWQAVQRLLATVRGRVPDEELAQALLIAGRCATYLLDDTGGAADALLTEAAERLADLDDEEGLVEVWILRGFLAQQSADFDESQRWYRQAADTLQARGDLRRLAFVRFRQARTAFLADAFAEAGALAAESLRFYTELDDPRGVLECKATLGLAAYGAGQLDEAIAYFQDSLTLAEQLGNRARVANSLSNLGAIALEQGRYDDARRWYDQALAEFEAAGDRPGVALVWNNLGLLAETTGDLEEAKRTLQASLAIRQTLGELRSLVITRINLGFVLEARGELEEALAQLRAAVLAGVEKNVEGWCAEALAGVSLVWMRTGRLGDATELAGLVLESPALSPYARGKLDARLQEVRAEMSDEWVDARLATGRAGDIRAAALAAICPAPP